MSRLKDKLAEIQQMEDGKFVDTETGEVTDYAPKEETPGVKFTEEKQQAKNVYLDDKYYNQWGKVSPINIVMLDNMNSLVSMEPRAAEEAIISAIEGLNSTFGNDESYDYVSQDFINKMRMNMDKMKTTNKIVEYLTNMYFKGINMGSGKSRSASIVNNTILSFDISDKTLLNKILVGLNALAKLK